MKMTETQQRLNTTKRNPRYSCTSISVLYKNGEDLFHIFTNYIKVANVYPK